jgi:Ca2+:H+ antiporter
VVPFFSNIAEQTLSILFAYRNEIDLCVGITVGSAVQISLFVLPGSVLIGWMVGSMSLFFHGFETASLLMPEKNLEYAFNNIT